MKKPIIIMMSLLVAILLGGTATFFLMKDTEPEDPNNIDLVLERSVETQAITTSLKDGTIAQVSFKIQTSSVETKEEVEKRMFQINNIIINYFASISTAEIERDEAIKELENTIKTKINNIMNDGEVEKIYTTSYVLQ